MGNLAHGDWSLIHITDGSPKEGDPKELEPQFCELARDALRRLSMIVESAADPR